MMNAPRLVSLALFVSIAGPALGPLPASAHPLGNFTVNRYARIEVRPEAIDVIYALDLAEIPAFSEVRTMDRDGDGQVSPSEADGFAAAKAEAIGKRLALTVNGRRAPLSPVTARAEIQAGQAGLSTLRVDARFTASTDVGTGTVEVFFQDLFEPERIGWREIVARAGEGVRLAGSTVPTTGLSDELRSYPDDLLASPPDRREARFAYEAAAVSSTSSPSALADAGLVPSSTQSVATRVGRPGPEMAPGELAAVLGSAGSGPGPLLLALLAAAGLGAAHALSPGHGKTIVAAYLTGSRGTPSQALLLGVTVTATHTAAVFALGGAAMLASAYVLPERLHSWLAAASGALVLIVGARLLISRLAHARHHHHHHSHHHDSADRPEGTSWRTLIALGISGGLLPCPSALVLMLSAIALQQVGLGLLLTAAFSTGLALVLVAVGLLVVAAQRASVRLPRLSSGIPLRLAAGAPVMGALVVTLAGLALTVEGMARVIG